MTDHPTIASLQQELSDARDLLDNQERCMDGLKDDLRTARAEVKLAERAYAACDKKLKDAQTLLAVIPKETAVSFDPVLLTLWKHDLEFAIGKLPESADARFKLDRVLTEISRRL